MRVLGLAAGAADSAAALVENGAVIAAAQEERFSRHKHAGGFPTQAAAYCLTQAAGGLEAVDLVVVYGDDGDAARCLAPLRQLHPGFDAGRLMALPPHLCHAASAFFPSDCDRAAILVLDGGQAAIPTAWGRGHGNRLDLTGHQPGPDSLGLLYSAVTAYIGFRPHSGEYKVMGLAPYGTPRYAQRLLDEVIAVADDGRFRLNPAWIAADPANHRLAALFGQPARKADDPELAAFHMDMAASVQAVTEEVIVRLARTVRRDSGETALCLGGGVALNCVANGKLARAGIFDRLWVQPAAGTAGGALGAALAGDHLHGGQARPAPIPGHDGMAGALLGPHWPQDEIERRLAAVGARFTVLDDDALLDRVVHTLTAGKAVGWMQGRMEFGPRALGNRSILGDPRSPTMQRVLNLKVKFRESFRPFAPAVLRQDAADWFALDGDSPYMLLVAPVADHRRHPLSVADQAVAGIDRLKVTRSSIPAVTHVDFSARVQTVDAATNPRFHALLRRFAAETQCPVLVNTSFNVRGEPIVCTPEDAFRCFMGCGIDALAVGNCWLDKDGQDPALALDYRTAFAPD